MKTRPVHELEIFSKRIPKIIFQIKAINEANAKAFIEIRNRFSQLMPLAKEQFKVLLLEASVLKIRNSKPNDAHFLAIYVNALMVESDKLCVTTNEAAANKWLAMPKNIISESMLNNFVAFMENEINEAAHMKGLSENAVKGLSDNFNDVIAEFKAKDVMLRKYESDLFRFKERIIKKAKDIEETIDGLENYLNDRGVSADNTPSREKSRIVETLLSEENNARELKKMNLSYDELTHPLIELQPSKIVTEKEILAYVKKSLKEQVTEMQLSNNKSTTFKPAKTDSKKMIPAPAKPARRGIFGK